MTSLAPRGPRDALSLHHETVREQLPNGLTLLVRRDRSAPVVAIVTHVKAGYFDETDDIVGIAHVLEHMFFKGTATRGVGQIARETKTNGGYLNAHTIYDHTSYYTVLPSAALLQGLDIQFDAYANSVIDAGELARELEVIIQEAKRKRDSPHAVAIESLYALLHDQHRIRRWRIGDEDPLRALTRDQLMSFYRYWYRPSNTVLSIVGDVDPDQVRREVMARHGTLDAGEPERARGPMETSAPGFRFREWTGDIAQQQLAFGWRAPGIMHPDSAALDLAAIALGTGRASRLYRAVRERQLASSVSAWNYTTDNIGVFVTGAESPSAHAPEAAVQLWREVQAARTVGFRTSEVVRAQRIIEARWLRRLESMDGQASYLASWEAEGGLDLATTYNERLMALTADALQDAVKRHLDPSQVSVVSYRPTDSEPLAADADALRQMLRDVEGAGSSVLPPPTVPTPSSTPAIGSPFLRLDPVAERLSDGVHVFRTLHGVPVLILPRPGAPIATIGVYQRGGSCLEPAGGEGLARLSAQSMLKGTTSRTGARIAEATEELGASIGVSASLESLGWSLSVPTRHLSVAAELLADVTQHPTFPVDGVETERALAIAEYGRLRDDMYRWPMRMATSAAYASHPYARSVIGTSDSLAKLDADAARAFHAAHVQQAASVIALVGDVQPEEAAAMVIRAFDTLAFRDDVAPDPVQWSAVALNANDTREKQQTALALLFPGPARNDPERFSTQVLSAIASGLGGRFFEQLRDKQSLAYTVSAFPIERRMAGSFAAYIATSPAREDEARAGLLTEFAKLREQAPTMDELDRARRYLIGTNAISQQSAGSVLGDLVEAWLFGDGLHEPSEYGSRIASVTAQAVLDVSRRYFDPTRVIEGVVRGTGK